MYSHAVTKVGILGASGFTGAELLRLCAGHPDFDVVHAGANTSAGAAVSDLYPSLLGAYPDLNFGGSSPVDVAGCDLVFTALPHGESQALMPALLGQTGCVVDLSADFRLADAELYPRWYGASHSAPELLAERAFGIPELFGEQLPGARLIAAAGCYVTAAALALAPFIRRGLVEPSGIVVDATSGVSGAGKAATETTHFAHVDGGFTAYGLINHRHTPEIEQALGGASVIFTPHLAPMTRGILATSYARPLPGEIPDSDGAIEVLRAFYAEMPFVRVVDSPPSTKQVTGSNMALITARVDPRTGWLIVLSAIDNLVKGASGQAIQCANLALGLDETLGLPMAAVFP